MQNNIDKAFTLIELIVVITILAILATVAFISFQGYLSSSRDSVRLADIKNITKSFEINRTKDINFPFPDKKIDISASGTIIQYQGELTQDILQKYLNIFDGGLDPIDSKAYGYSINATKNKFQIIGFLENQKNIANIPQNIAFSDNRDKYLISSGDELGFLLDANTNEVIIQSGSIDKINILDTNINHSIYINNDIHYGGHEILAGFLLYRAKKNNSCKSILHFNRSSKSGIYTIYPHDNEGLEVYCDMETDGGGWTKTHAVNYNFYNGSPIVLSTIFTQTNDYGINGYTTDISYIAYGEFAYMTDDSRNNIEFLNIDYVKTIGYKSQGFQKWVEAYSQNIHSKPFFRKQWYYFTNFNKTNKQVLLVDGDESGFHHMRHTEKLTSGSNKGKNTSGRQGSNFPFSKRGFGEHQQWCYGGNKICVFSEDGSQDGNNWASLWVR